MHIIDYVSWFPWVRNSEYRGHDLCLMLQVWGLRCGSRRVEGWVLESSKVSFSYESGG